MWIAFGLLYLSLHLFSSLSHWLGLSELEYKRLYKLPKSCVENMAIVRLSRNLCLKDT